MTELPHPRVPRLARRIASLLLRGPESRFMLDDLDDLFVRDLERGVTPSRARRRYRRNVLASVLSVWRARLYWPPATGASWLDVKLGLRMLRKHPGLTFVAGFALAVGIPVGLAPLHLANALNRPLPFEEGERLRSIEFWNRTDELRPTLHDFQAWRDELTSFQDLGASSTVLENVADEEGLAEAVSGAQVTASTFGVLRVRPYLGRVLVDADEAKGAPDVVVLGYDLWQTRFGGDPELVGRTIRVGSTHRVVVGVMPRGFAFPVRQGFWIPLQARALDYEWGAGPRLLVLGRLIDGTSPAQAQVELTTVAGRIAADHPDTHRDLRADLIPVPWAITGLRPSLARVAPAVLVTILLLAVTCGNVGTLTVARAASRSREIAIRNALGAGRGRIVRQLFVESLVLATLATSVGLGMGEMVVRTLLTPMVHAMPSWFRLGLTPKTVVLGGGLAVFSAVITGVFPALRATGRNVHRSLQRAAAGASGMHFGAVSTVLIVTEVALAVGCLSVVATTARSSLKDTDRDLGIAPEEYLSVTLRLQVSGTLTTDAERAAFIARFGAIQDEVVGRVSSEPGVLGVALADRLPGMDHPSANVEVDGRAPPEGLRGYRVHRALVRPGFFEGLGEPVREGRGFDSRDLGTVRPTVVVNRSFVQQVMGGQNPIGQRVRYATDPDVEPGPWYEIVGVADDLGMNVSQAGRGAGIYHPVALGEIHPLRIAVHLATDPASFIPRLLKITTSADPAAMIYDPRPLDQEFSMQLWGTRMSGFLFALVAAIAIVLSAVGHYALMSFTVSERRKEIAIRMALGARRRRIAAVVLTRALAQIGAGVSVGIWLGPAMIGKFAMVPAAGRTDQILLVVAVAAAMTAAGLLACAGPTLRALRIQPNRALAE